MTMHEGPGIEGRLRKRRGSTKEDVIRRRIGCKKEDVNGRTTSGTCHDHPIELDSHESPTETEKREPNQNEARGSSVSDEPERQEPRRGYVNEEPQTIQAKMQFEQLGRELRTDFAMRQECEQIVSTTIADHEGRIAQVRLENVRLKFKVDFCEMYVRKMHECLERFEKSVEFEREKGVRLQDTLMVCEQNLQDEKEKRLNLEENVRNMKQNMEEAKEKQTCQICMEKTRNAVILPCLHFLYCGGCLQNHQKKSNECPTCRGSIGAVLNCKFNLE